MGDETLKIKKDGSDDIYVQLQEILNKCTDLLWKPRGFSYCYYDLNQKQIHRNIVCDECGVEVEQSPESEYFINYSYHDLFSKDSGLMEFVKWRNKNDGKVLEVIDKKHNLRYVFDDKYMYKHMSYLTAEEKIQYFLDNAILPTVSA